MSILPKCPTCGRLEGLPHGENCPGSLTFIQCGSMACEHDFQGWRDHEDGHGGEQFCSKCGLGAMAWSLMLDDLP